MLKTQVRLSGISKSDWDQTTALHDCFEDTLRSVVNFVSERAFVLSCGVHEMEDEYVHSTMSRSVNSSSNNVDDDQTTMTKEDTADDDDDDDDSLVSSKAVDRGGNPDLTMLLQKKGKTFLARTFLPKTQRQCVLNDYSFSFGRATYVSITYEFSLYHSMYTRKIHTLENRTRTLTPTNHLEHRYNVTAHASKTVIPLFMIWKVVCEETRWKELYDITIHLRHDRPKDGIYKKSFFSFIMKANKSDAHRRNEEFQRRLACLCMYHQDSGLSIVGKSVLSNSSHAHSQKTKKKLLYVNNVRTNTGGEKQSRVPPFPDILDDLRKDGDDSSTKIDDKSGTREERIFGSVVDQDGYFS